MDNSFLLLSGIILGTAILVLRLHGTASSWLSLPKPEAFKVTRGLAGTTLTLLGLSCAALYWPNWREGFLAPHGLTSWPSAVMAIALGIFAAELGWVVTLRLRDGIPWRAELVGHHLVGLAAASCALLCGMGQATAAAALVTEVLPLSGTLVAWGHHRGRPDWAQLGYQSRIWLLKYWRIPVWVFFLVTLQSAWLDGRATLGHLVGSGPWALQAAAVCRLVACGACLGLIGHDLYCLKLCRASQLRAARQPAPQPSLP